MSSKPIILAIIISCCIWSIGHAHLNLYMSEKETRALLGIDGELFYVRNGIINKYALGFNVLIPSHMPSINFTWQSLKQSPSAMYYKMAFKVSNPKAMAPPVPSPLDKDGIVPNTPSNFHISLPCTGKVSAVVSVEIQLNISIFSASNLTSLNIKRRKVCVKDGESVYDFAAENANPVENVATTSTNIFYIAVGCACALILVIALIVAIYYICTSRRRPPRDRKRYEEYQPSQYDTASSQALSANTHNQPPLHNGSQQYMSQNGSLASIPGGRRPGYASSNSDYKPPPQDPRVTLSDITINRKCVTLGDCLLTGTFGKVYHAKVISESEEDGITQQDVYVKTVTEEARSDQVEVLLRECATMKGFNNPNINPIMAVCICI
ncbi:unnamed protein product [Owenia fusiformis]|uniref:WIF domain-containing protein n=1 Tax=Owenia fusiformis TaxID=6347 RepID=A0A8S4NHA6_OWEFU|nr:unnamed protein product [Owenia fusiformis]